MFAGDCEEDSELYLEPFAVSTDKEILRSASKQK